MSDLLRQLDRLLRGDFTRPDELGQGRVAVPLRTLVVACLLCGVVYGLCMGLYAATSGLERGALQFASSAFKVPLLFLLTLVVTFPSLYVFAALAGSSLRVHDMLRLLVAAVTVDMAVLASFGPVTVFFTVFTTSYPFVALLNVIFFLIAGAVSLGFLMRAVGAVFRDDAPAAQGAPSQSRARSIIRVWIVIYGVVGTQMGWILRPFIGNPELPFVWFRHHRESNVFAALLDLLRDVGGGW